MNGIHTKYRHGQMRKKRKKVSISFVLYYGSAWRFRNLFLSLWHETPPHITSPRKRKGGHSLGCRWKRLGQTLEGTPTLAQGHSRRDFWFGTAFGSSERSSKRNGLVWPRTGRLLPTVESRAVCRSIESMDWLLQVTLDFSSCSPCDNHLLNNDAPRRASCGEASSRRPTTSHPVDKLFRRGSCRSIPVRRAPP